MIVMHLNGPSVVCLLDLPQINTHANVSNVLDTNTHEQQRFVREGIQRLTPHRTMPLASANQNSCAALGIRKKKSSDLLCNE